MMQTMSYSVRAACLLLALAACGDDTAPPTGDGGVRTDAPGTDTGPVPCREGSYRCQGADRLMCTAGTLERVETCPSACDPALGCVDCVPGSRRCEGDVSMICRADGMGYVTGRDCTENGAACGAGGYCNDICGEAESTNSNVGCEYWPVALPTESTDTRFFFHVVVANPSDVPADITIRHGDSVVDERTIAPHDAEAIKLERYDLRLGGSEYGSYVLPDGALRLTSTRPVIAAQFRPFETYVAPDRPGPAHPIYNPHGFASNNDASLLLPAHTFTGNYIAATYMPISTRNAGAYEDGRTYPLETPSYVAVIGTTLEPTEVTVDYPVGLQGGLGASPTFAGSTGPTQVTFMLARGEVAILANASPKLQDPCAIEDATNEVHWSVEDAPPNGRSTWFCRAIDFDPTGARIRAAHPVAVFGGHRCAFVPHDHYACDHLESQMPALETWGTRYVTSAIGDPDNANGFNIVRVMAAVDGTTVQFTPAQNGMSEVSLDENEWHEFELRGGIQIDANQGIMVVQYLVGQDATDPPASVGDPAMFVVPPVQQLRSDYTFIAPTSFQQREPVDVGLAELFDPSGQNYVLLTRTPGLAIQLDGANIDATWTAAGDYEYAVIPIAGGVRELSAAGEFGAVVFGLSAFTSYAYVAGLNLEPIFELI